MQDFSGFDFIDFGASKGGSLRWASNLFGGKGIGVDNSPAKIELVRQNGGQAILADATKLNIPPGTFRYATMIDFLEHLPDQATGFSVLEQAIAAVREFVVVKGPNFDGLDHLRKMGFKKYYADWRGHKWHHKASEFAEILGRLGARHRIIESERIRDTAHSTVLALDAKRDRGPYNPAVDPPKPTLPIKPPTYDLITVIVAKTPDVDMLDIFVKAAGMRMTVGR